MTVETRPCVKMRPPETSRRLKSVKTLCNEIASEVLAAIPETIVGIVGVSYSVGKYNIDYQKKGSWGDSDALLPIIVIRKKKTVLELEREKVSPGRQEWILKDARRGKRKLKDQELRSFIEDGLGLMRRTPPHLLKSY